jgi:hypothetical protein
MKKIKTILKNEYKDVLQFEYPQAFENIESIIKINLQNKFTKMMTIPQEILDKLKPL